MTSEWDQIWNAFVVAVERLDERIRPNERGVVSRLHRSSNDRFPLRALVAYSPIEAPSDEQLAISVDFLYDGHRLVGSADLARGSGLVLAEAEVLAPLESRGGAIDGHQAAVARRTVEEFVRHQHDTIVSELET